MKASVAFYERYCGMRVVHERQDQSHVVWMGWGEDPPRFVIVLIQKPYEQNIQPPWQHMGLAVDPRDEVNAVHQRAEADGLAELWPPTDGGPVVGYFCGLLDPDGNRVEFSYGQHIG